MRSTWRPRHERRAPLGPRLASECVRVWSTVQGAGGPSLNRLTWRAYDNAMAKSFFAALECECLAKPRFATHTVARFAVFRYIEGWYNGHRRHSALGQHSTLASSKLTLHNPWLHENPTPVPLRNGVKFEAVVVDRLA
jgi:hypothetical protein